MKHKLIYSTFFFMLLCFAASQIQAQTITAFTTAGDGTWTGYSTPGRNQAPLIYNTIIAGSWTSVETSNSLPNYCLDAPLTFPGTPIFSAGNVQCYNGATGIITSYFRRNFTLNGGSNPLCSAMITVRADNLFRVYVDGTLVPGINTSACNGWSYQNLSGWNYNTIYTVNIMPYINLSLTSHTIVFEVGNCDYVNYLAASVTIDQGLPHYSPDFEVETSCNNNWSVTATPIGPFPSNNVWELFETSVPGATTGGTLVATQTGTTANFQWLDLSKFYYITHRVQVGCNETVKATHEVQHINNATLIYHFEDANGVVKDEFCMGEEVFLNPAGTTNYDRYVMTISSRIIDSGDPFSNPFNYGYVFTNDIGLLNLTQIFGAAGYVFLPGMEYEIHFVIQNIPNCIAWVELRKTFTLVCCPTTPDFNVVINCSSGWGVTATPVNNTPTNHIWQLFQTTVPGATTGGTQVGPDQYGTSVNYQWLDQSASYYIKHSVFVEGCYDILTSSVAVPTFASNANLAYSLENESGVEKDVFCVGEDIYLDPTGTTNFDRYFLTVWRRVSGTNGPFQTHVSLGFTFSNSISLLNLSQLFPGAFVPGFDYEIQFAIQNPPNCIPWIELRKRFTVECCDGYISAQFFLDMIDGEQGQELVVRDFKTYENTPAVHTWTVLSSPNQNGGPYTLVLETTTTGAGPFTLYNQGASGLFYFVIHRVSTVCGDVCYGKQKEGHSLSGNSEPDGGAECELCREIDCSILDEICLTPQYERAFCSSPSLGAVTFQWLPVHGATQYQVQLIFNDPACCHSGMGSFPVTYNVTNANSLSLGGMDRRCFKWRVGVLCNEQIVWTEYHCFSGCVDSPHGSGTSFGLAESGTSTTAAAPVSVKIYPNPANEEISILLADDAPVDLVKITDLQGKTVFEKSRPEQRLNVNSSNFIAGMYAIRVIYQDGSQVVEHIVITH